MTDDEMWEQEINQLRAARLAEILRLADLTSDHARYRALTRKYDAARQARFMREDYLLWKLSYDA